jgi:hypothetical protein
MRHLPRKYVTVLVVQTIQLFQFDSREVAQRQLKNIREPKERHRCLPSVPKILESHCGYLLYFFASYTYRYEKGESHLRRPPLRSTVETQQSKDTP